MSVIHAPKRPPIDFRVMVFPIAIGLGMAMLVLRLWYFQVVRSSDLAEAAEVSSSTRIEKPAPRGLIFDRKGVLLAGVRNEFVVMATPGVVRKNRWVFEKLGGMLGVAPAKLESTMNKEGWRPFVPVPVFRSVPIETATRIAEAKDDLPGITIDSQAMRYYPDPLTYAHVLGYVWTANENDLLRIKAFTSDTPSFVGKTGIERSYDEALLGKPGKDQVELDGKRHPVRIISGDAPTPGQRLILSIDADLQKYAAAVLKERNYLGAIVAIDPSNGEVLCAVCSPTFDASMWMGSVSQEDYDRVTKDPDHPMFNRAFSAHYMPGSTFKIVTSIAAYRAGKFDLNRTTFCAGGYRIGNRFVKCLGNHGYISYLSAMERSCNTYFADLGNDVGLENLRQAALDCGLGQRAGIDTTGDSPGIVPTERWIDKYRKGVWYPGDTVNFAIGQGDIEATPLQMAQVMALVVNNGVCYKPHLVHAIQPAARSGMPIYTEPEVAHRVDAPESFWVALKTALLRVVDNGTAKSARIPGLEWGGKTGSAEKRGQDKTNSWFVGGAPFDKPRIVIAVLTEQAGHGGDVSAPIARDIVKHYLTRSASAASSSESARSAQPEPSASPTDR